MPYHTTDREGITLINPSEEEMRAIINSLKDDDSSPENPDVWLTHDSGWSISLFPSKLAILENELTDERKQLTQVDTTQGLHLWQLLSEGKLNELLKKNWKDCDDF